MDMNFQKLVLAVKETVLNRGQSSIIFVPGSDEDEISENQRKILKGFEHHDEVVARSGIQENRRIIIVEFP